MSQARYLKHACVVAVAVLSLAPTLMASPIVAVEGQEFLLGDLVGSEGFIWGDKLFHDFSFTETAEGGALAPGATIALTPIEINGDLGLIYNAFWGAAPGQWADTVIRFSVRVLDEEMFIKDVALAAPAMTTFGPGTAIITESVYAEFPGDLLSSLAVFDTADGRVTHDQAEFDPVKEVHVVTDIGVSGDAVGLASISDVTQTFSQIPEPATLTLLVVGGLLGLRRRK